MFKFVLFRGKKLTFQNRVSSEIFLPKITHSNLGLYAQENPSQWKDFYIKFLPNHIKQAESFVKAELILRRLNLPPKDKNFLRFYIYVYYGEPEPSGKQVVNIPLEACELSTADGTINIFIETDKQKLLYFFGEEGLQSTIELMAVDRRLSPPLQLIHSTKLYRASMKDTKEKGYHYFASYGGVETRIRITTLVSDPICLFF